MPLPSPRRLALAALASAPLLSGVALANRPPMLRIPERVGLPEGIPWSGRITALDPEGAATTLSVTGLPPGARWLPREGRITFTPDFIQGGQRWTVQVKASDGERTATGAFEIAVHDTLRPPAPQILSESREGRCTILKLQQTTDVFLDEEYKAGRGIPAAISVPNTPGPLPVKISLHGFGGGPRARCNPRAIVIAPYDPQNSYWWGHGQRALGGAGAPDYTARRVLHLMAWARDHVPSFDPDRVYISGHSMGGAGAATIGLLHSRHFAWIHAREGQAIPRNHRPSRLAQLTPQWGPIAPDGKGRHGIWDHMDLTRVVAEVPEAQQQFISLEHGKDDPVIHFGAVVQPSPLTHKTFYQALQANHIGHFAAWDEGGHGPPDPVLGHRWWTDGWHPIFDDVTFLRRDLAFPAFSNSSLDDNPGGFVGNGTLLWDDKMGYAGDQRRPGDTGWDGDIAGTINRFFRWDARAIVDSEGRFEIPLKLADGEGGPPPRPGYPTTGDRLPAPRQATADVTPRRLQVFAPAPGDLIRWRYGAKSGAVRVAPDGAITVPGLLITPTWTTLTLTR